MKEKSLALNRIVGNTKIAGKEIVSATDSEQSQGGNVIDLMEALKASIGQNQTDKKTAPKKKKGA